MLIDERMKSENHKTNYQILKTEHSCLQDEFTRVQSELRRLQSDQQSEQEKVKLLFAELQGELLDKTRELEDLRLLVMTPQRLELLRAQVQQEMEAPVRERFNMLDTEPEYNRVRYDYTILKSQFDHQTNEHARVLEDRRIRYEAEIGRLEKDREELVTQYQESDILRDGKRVETLLREKAQLHLRMKGLEAEVAELQAQKESSGQQAERCQTLVCRCVSNWSGWRVSWVLSCEQSILLSGKLHKAEREVSSLCSQYDKLESLKYSHKMEMATVKLDCARAKGEMERERDTLQRQIDGTHLQTDVEVVTAALERHKEVLVETQRETARRVQCAREEELRKSAALLEEKLELEHRLASIEHQRALQEASDHNLKEDWEERLRRVQQSEECARKELHNLRCVFLMLACVCCHKVLHAIIGQNNISKVSSLLQLERLSRSESDLKETKQRLQQVSERLREELRAALAQAEKSQDEAERLMEQRQVEWFQEEHKLQQREAELQQKYSHVKEKLQRAAMAQKKVELTITTCPSKNESLGI
uniref:Centrosomal protein 83 n=1 Tax=Gouania willdenowi TaxID=441366 RepID=A0A8C5DR84_GOUWI